MKNLDITFIKELETLLNKYKICITPPLTPGFAFNLNAFDQMEILQDDKACDKMLSKIKLCKKKNTDNNNYYYKITIKNRSKKKKEKASEMDI